MLSPPSSVSVIIDTPLPVIIGNKIQMGQVYQNLVGNAIKFMDKEEGIIHIGCTEEKDAYLFYVKDNGPGIEQKYFTKVFQIFQTLTSRDVKENTGVGLALVKKIIELYGGTIWIESEKGIGCTFTFRLPKQKLHEQ
jgi:signal transduction histidine kinase